MIDPTDGVLGVVGTVGLVGLMLAAVFVFVRLVRGPTLADRIVAVDMLAYVLVGFMALYATVSRQMVFLDVAMTLSLVAFVATVAFARFVRGLGPGGAESWKS